MDAILTGPALAQSRFYLGRVTNSLTMRLLVSLKAANAQSYERLYHHKLQGWIYELLRVSGFGTVHDKEGYKFICFSNLFPIRDMPAGARANLLIASPNKAMIASLEGTLRAIAASETRIHIGEMSFDLLDLTRLDTQLEGRTLRVMTATPVIIRIPERNYDRYGIPESERKRRYVYWRPKYPFDAFLKQLSENLIKKYNEFHGTDIDTPDLFEQFVFRRPTATKVVIDGREYVLVGSMWEFIWSSLTGQQRTLLTFGLDAGFGERSSLGFGFVNRVGDGAHGR